MGLGFFLYAEFISSGIACLYMGNGWQSLADSVKPVTALPGHLTPAVIGTHSTSCHRWHLVVDNFTSNLPGLWASTKPFPPSRFSWVLLSCVSSFVPAAANFPKTFLSLVSYKLVGPSANTREPGCKKRMRTWRRSRAGWAGAGFMTVLFLLPGAEQCEETRHRRKGKTIKKKSAWKQELWALLPTEVYFDLKVGKHKPHRLAWNIWSM